MFHNNWYDRSPMWPVFNHCRPKPAPEEPYDSPYAVLGYDEQGNPVFIVHSRDGEEHTVPVDNDIIVLGDTTYTIALSRDRTELILRDNNGKEVRLSFVADSDSPGFISAEDKAKLDGIEEGAEKNTVLGVKGSADASYRTGLVELSKEDLGIHDLNKADIADVLGYLPSKTELVRSEMVSIVANGEIAVSMNPAAFGTNTCLEARPIARVYGVTKADALAIQHFETIGQDEYALYIRNTDANSPHSVYYFIDAVKQAYDL